MKVSLISVYETVISYGMRSLSAILKQGGVETQMIFLPRETEGLRWEGFRYSFSDSVLHQVAHLVKNSDLIGITLMSNYFDNAVQITQYLRHHTEAPIVWGGIHPTIRPEECLQHADIVCVGEGEDALRDLVQSLAVGKGYEGIDNMWYKRDKEIVRTPLRPLQFDLDRYPYPDYALDDSFVLHDGHIRPMTEQILLYYLCWPYSSDSEPTYTTMMSRGCTWSCAYCGNSALRDIYHSQWRVRRRSVPNFIGELKQIAVQHPGFRWIKIEDDVFLDDIGILREFASTYEHEVGLPLFITGFQPSMVDEEKIGLLIDAGMKRVRVGIQTGSESILHRVYQRPGKLEHIMQVFRVLHKFADRLEPPMYDLIVDNPWETEEDHLKTLRMLLDMPKPYQLNLFSLTFYPGTKLYDRAKEEGILQDDFNQVYRKDYFTSQRTYTNGLLKLFQSQRAPRWLMAFLLNDTMNRCKWVWLPYSLYWVFHMINLLVAGWRVLQDRDWSGFKNAIHARVRHYSAWLYSKGK
jgi:anaerobic magnesium-protoporphyrin IX monomethyl ester cyclase